MTQERGPRVNPSPQDMHVLPEPLPQQEEFYRPPVRFGPIPLEAEPLGWDSRQQFKKHYPRVDLPTQIIERVSLGMDEAHEPNRLIWGDNLHVMRQIPSNSVDLIYIDPPFFSGKQYNVMWGDANETRSFNDIWEGGMPGYLVWLNARLYEMKRLLKPTGSIYVHCDWHASHYIKVEMDKIFGYENFRNEVIWNYGKMSNATKNFPANHDMILRYSISENFTFTPIKGEESEYKKRFSRYLTGNQVLYGSVKDSEDKLITGRIKKIERGIERTVQDDDVLFDFDVEFKAQSDVIYASIIKGNSSERIGYPTQKPEALIERIIMASSNKGNVVADFFVGGGTTAAVAQRLGRRFIGCDQSRVAVAVTAERLKQQAVKRELEDAPIPDFTVEHWGIYETGRLSGMPSSEFQKFVLGAYGASPMDNGADGAHIHGWRNHLPVWVGGPGQVNFVNAEEVRGFADAITETAQYRDANLRDGVMLAWGFTDEARDAADFLRRRESVDIDFIHIRQVRIGDADFREHIVDRAGYSDFLTFVHPVEVSVGYNSNGGRAVTFDAGDSSVVNFESNIVNVQWDFNYDGKRFTATPRHSFQRGGPQFRVTHKFERAGRFRVACRVQDSRGGEGTWVGDVEVS